MYNIVLVNPEIPQNTGNIVRTCAATGATLHLIKPLGFSLEDKYLKRAGLDYWQDADIIIYENYEEFEAKNANGRFFAVTTKGDKSYTDFQYKENDYLLFGRETAGLGAALLEKYKDTKIRIPMVKDTRSLNLSNSVCIVLFEALRQKDFQGFLSRRTDV